MNDGNDYRSFIHGFYAKRNLVRKRYYEIPVPRAAWRKPVFARGRIFFGDGKFLTILVASSRSCGIIPHLSV
jgi:hypothetical protein